MESIDKNLEIYEALRSVPATAMKMISGGRLNGMTDINPVWRIKALTAEFGPCGFGWWPVIKDKRLERVDNSEEIAAIVDIDLYVRWKGEVSQPIPGTGGSMYLVKEKGGLRINDEAFKMALTDAVSVAAKFLGVGADVYFAKDVTKYTTTDEPAPTAPPAPPQKITYEEALEFVMPDTVHQGRTLREIFKSSRGDVQIIYNTTQDSKAREAINAVYEGIKRANEAKKANSVNLAEVS